MNYSRDSVNQKLPSTAAGAHVKVPHLTHNMFGSDGDINKYSRTDSRVPSHIVIKPIISNNAKDVHLSLFTGDICILAANADG